MLLTREHVETRVERTLHPRGRIGDHPLLLIGRKLGDDVHLALQESGHARSRLGNGADDEPVEVRLAPPVVRIGIEGKAIVLDPGREAHGSRAHRLGVEGIVADRLEVLLRHDLAAVEGEAGRQERVGLLGVDQKRVRVGRLDPVDGREHRRDQGLGVRVVGALDAELGVGRGERIAVVELHALPQLERPRGLPLELRLEGEAGVELAIGMAAGQVVEDVEAPANVVGGSAEVWIELGDVAALSDHELLLLGGLRVRRSGKRLGQGSRRTQSRRAFEQFSSSDSHRLHLHWVGSGHG